MTTDELIRLAHEAGIIPWNRLHWSTDQFVTIDEGMDGDLACLTQFAALVVANTRCPNCASLEAQNTELDVKLAELERKLGEGATGSMWEDTLMRCIDHHAAELFRLRAKVQQLEALPQRKPLTEEQLHALYDEHAAYQEEGPATSGWFNFARAIERAHGIGEKE